MKIEAIILAAGKGTRMKSDLPKVMHKIGSKPMIGQIIETLQPLCSYLNIVTGHGREMVEKHISSNYSGVKFSFQAKQNGTGGAVKAAVPNIAGDSTHILICAGDTPLIKKETFEKMIADLKNNSGDLSVVTTVLDDAGSYGRIVRDDHGNVKGIIEYLDADENQIKIREINSGIYLVEKKFLVEAVYKIKNNNSKYEYYLTDIVKIALKMGKKVVAFIEDDNISLSGINDPDQLKEAEKEFIKRTSASV